jgi:hypothetical protein
MARIDRSYGAGKVSADTLLGALERTNKILEGRISFGRTNANDQPYNNGTTPAPDHANVQTWKATGTTPSSANTEFAVPHNLLWVPWHYFYHLNVNGVLYQDATTGTAWTAATTSAMGNIYLKCSVGSAAFTIMIV